MSEWVGGLDERGWIEERGDLRLLSMGWDRKGEMRGDGEGEYETERVVLEAMVMSFQNYTDVVVKRHYRLIDTR